MQPLRAVFVALFLSVVSSGVPAQAAFIVGAHSSEKGHANFAFGSDTTTASASVASTAVGLVGTNSIFGGNGSAADVYTFSYTPGTDADNTLFAPGTPLGNSTATDVDGAGPAAPTFATSPQLASGLAGGRSGFYKVYFTTPASTGVVGTTHFEVQGDLGTLSLNPVNLNTGNTGPAPANVGGANNAWLHIATVPLTTGNTYRVTMTSSGTAFVSQRAHAVMWEHVIPEPSGIALAGVALARCASFARRRRRLQP
jgi:hypothetical protein